MVKLVDIFVLTKFLNMLIMASIFDIFWTRPNEGKNFKTLCIISSCLKVSLNTTWYFILLNPWYSIHFLFAYCKFHSTLRLLCLLLISAVNKSILRLKSITLLYAVIISKTYSRAGSITLMRLYPPYWWSIQSAK